MLTQDDKNKIMELRSQDFSYKAIHARLGFAVDTIMKVYNEEKERKAKELEEVSRVKAEDGQIKGDLVSLGSSIDEIRKIVENIDYLIKKEELKAEDRREWDRRKEDLQEMLRVEVEDRISKERADAIEARDRMWWKILEQNYVKKEVSTDLDNMIKTRDAAIEDLRNDIRQKDDLINNRKYGMFQLNASHQLKKEDLKNQIRDLLMKNNGLNEENWRLHYYKENSLDSGRCTKAKHSILNELYFDVDKKSKDAEILEKKLAVQELKLKRREDNFDKKVNQICDVYKERIKAVEKREENVIQVEKSLLRQKEELDKERGRIQDDRGYISKEWEKINKIKEELRTERQRLHKWQKTLEKTVVFNKVSTLHTSYRKAKLVDVTVQKRSEQQKHVTLIPISISGGPIIKSGFSPIAQSGNEVKVVGFSD